MDFSTFLMGIGMVGTSFLAGFIIRSFWIREAVAGAGILLGAMLFMGLVAAVASASRPLLEPLWVQYALFLALPFALGFLAAVMLMRGTASTEAEQ